MEVSRINAEQRIAFFTKTTYNSFCNLERVECLQARYSNHNYATLAQLVEHRFCKPQVVSSNLTSGSVNE